MGGGGRDGGGRRGVGREGRLITPSQPLKTGSKSPSFIRSADHSSSVPGCSYESSRIQGRAVRRRQRWRKRQRTESEMGGGGAGQFVDHQLAMGARNAVGLKLCLFPRIFSFGTRACFLSHGIRRTDHPADGLVWRRADGTIPGGAMLGAGAIFGHRRE